MNLILCHIIQQTLYNNNPHIYNKYIFYICIYNFYDRTLNFYNIYVFEFGYCTCSKFNVDYRQWISQCILVHKIKIPIQLYNKYNIIIYIN